MAMKIIKKEEVFYMVDDSAINKVRREIDRHNMQIAGLAAIWAKYEPFLADSGLIANKSLSLAVLHGGIDAFRDEVKSRCLAGLADVKSLPKISRLSIADKAIEAIPDGLTVDLVAWADRLESMSINVPDSAYTYKKGVLAIAPDFIDGLEESMLIPIDQRFVNACEVIRQAVSMLRPIDDLGIMIADGMVWNPSTSSMLPLPGMVSRLIGSRYAPDSRPDLTDEAILAAMLFCKAKTKAELDELKNNTK